MIIQTIDGQVVNTVNASGSSADLAILAGVLFGATESFKSLGGGGTTDVVASVNAIGISYGKKDGLYNRKSCAIFYPHINKTKTAKELMDATKGVFNANFKTELKSEYARVFSDKSEG